MKRIISIVICIAMMLTLIISTSAMESTTVDTSLQESIINTQYFDLMMYFSSVKFDQTNGQYPDFYSGAYIPEDYSKLIIYVTDDSEIVKNIIQTGTGNPNIEIVKVKYSYNEMLNQMKIIGDNIYEAKIAAEKSGNTALVNAYSSYVGCGIDDSDNSIKVYVEGLNIQKSSILQTQIADFDNIQYFEGQKSSEEKTFDPGTQITSGGVYHSSMGHRGVIIDPGTGKHVRGFWTAGHAVAGPGSEVFCANYNIGICIAQRYQNNTDIAFIKLHNQSSDEISLNLAYGGKSVSPNSYTGFAEGMAIYKCGFKTGETSGTVLTSSINFTSETGVQLTDFVEAYYIADSGDSGALIYALYNTGNYLVCGTHHGKVNYSYTAFTKYVNVTKVWNCYAWDYVDF